MCVVTHMTSSETLRSVHKLRLRSAKVPARRPPLLVPRFCMEASAKTDRLVPKSVDPISVMVATNCNGLFNNVTEQYRSALGNSFPRSDSSNTHHFSVLLPDNATPRISRQPQSVQLSQATILPPPGAQLQLMIAPSVMHTYVLPTPGQHQIFHAYQSPFASTYAIPSILQGTRNARMTRNHIPRLQRTARTVQIRRHSPVAPYRPVTRTQSPRYESRDRQSEDEAATEEEPEEWHEDTNISSIDDSMVRIRINDFEDLLPCCLACSFQAEDAPGLRLHYKECHAGFL